MDAKSEFSVRLNRALDDCGWPRTGKGRHVDLAAAMHVSQKGASKWLNGEAVPAMDNAIQLATLLRCNIEWLLTGRGEMRHCEFVADDRARYIVDQFEHLEEPDKDRIFRVIQALVPKDQKGAA